MPRTLTTFFNPTIAQRNVFAPTLPYAKDLHGGSAYFDGSNDWLDVANNNAFDTNSTFTFEAWFYRTAATDAVIFGRGGGVNTFSTSNGHQVFLYISTGGTLYWYWNNGGFSTYIATSYAIPANTWHHVVVGYNGTTTRVWLNGVSVGISTIPYTLPVTRNITRVGCTAVNAYLPFTGYISGLRFVKGTDVYGVTNTTIAVPTTPPTAIANTALLLNFTNSSINDDSGSTKQIEISGAYTTTFKSVSGNGSIYFPLSSYLKSGVQGDWTWMHGASAQWTVDFWIYDVNSSNTFNKYILCTNGGVGQGIGINISKNTNQKLLVGITNSVTGQALSAESTATIPLSNWTHVAVNYNHALSNNNLNIFINGSESGTVTKNAVIVPSSNLPTQTMFIGSRNGNTDFLNGYIDKLRIVRSSNRIPIINNSSTQQGVSATFNAQMGRVSGTISYQWKRNGINVGTNSSSYTVAEGNVGTYNITCVATNSIDGRAVTSNTAIHTVTAATVTITSQPASASVIQGVSNTFTVAATTQAGTLSYQWRKNSVAISGATSSSYTALETSVGTPSYDCVVTNITYGVGTASNAVTLTVTAATPTITAQPSNATVQQGVSYTVSVAATVPVTSPAGSLSYQWYRNSVAIVGATSATQTIVGGESGSGSYSLFCIVSNTNGFLTAGGVAPSVTSSTATITVTTNTVNISSPTTVGTQVLLLSATNPVLSVTATTAAGSLAYQWRKGSVNIGGATSSTYTVPTNIAGDGVFDCVVTNTTYNTTATSLAQTIRIVNLQITSQPTNVTTQQGTSATFNVVASTTQGTLSYQWNLNGTPIVGATSSSYSITQQAISTYNYTCTVTATTTGGSVSVTSSVATLTTTVNIITITSQPQSVFVEQGVSNTFSIGATTPAGTLSYQWKRDGVNVGTNSSTYTATETVVGTYVYTCVVTNTTYSTSTTSSNGLFNCVANTINITSQPQSNSLYAGISNTLTVGANTAAGTLSYQWKRNGINVGTNSSSYTVTETITNTYTYTCVITNIPYGTTVQTNTATVSILTPFVTITNQPVGSVIHYSPGTYTFNIVATTQYGTLSYQWKRNGINVGSNSSSLSVTETTNGVYNYSCVVTNTDYGVSATSNTVSLTVLDALPTITIQPVSKTYVQGAVAVFDIAATSPLGGGGGGTVLNYTWRKNGTIIQTTATPSLSFIENGIGKYDITCNVLYPNGIPAVTATSSTAVLTVSAVTINNVYTSASLNYNKFPGVYIGETTTFGALASSNGANPLGYEWCVIPVAGGIITPVEPDINEISWRFIP